MDLDALIKRTEARLAAETNPKRRAEIALDLATYAKTAAECDDEDDDGDDDEKKSKKSTKKSEEEEASASAKKAEEKKSEEEKKASKSAKKAEEYDDEEEEAKAALAAVQEVTGLTGAAAIGALRGMVARLGTVESVTKNLQAEQAKTERSALIARAGKFVPPHILKATVANMKLAGLRAYVAEVEKGAPMVATEDGDLLVPKELATGAGAEASLPKDVRDMIDQMCAAVPAKDREAFRKTSVEKILADQQKAMNGVGRY